jgi:hypothetical protein
LVWRIEKRDRVKLFVWGYEMKWGGIYRKNFELWFFIFFRFFLNFFEFFWITAGLTGRTGLIPGFPGSGRGRSGTSYPGFGGSGLARVFLNFFARARARPAGSNGSRVRRIWARDGSGRVTATDRTGRIWHGRVFLILYPEWIVQDSSFHNSYS